MDDKIEKRFVKSFVDKNAQDRIIFELAHNDLQKRIHSIAKFAHFQGKYLNKNHIYLANKMLTIEDVEKEITKLQVQEKVCYIMNNTYNGEFMPIRKALEVSFDYLGVSIIIVGNNFVFIKTEASIGAPMKFILHKKQ